MALVHLLSQSVSRIEEISLPRMHASARQPSASLSGNLNRLLSAAVVNPRFQRLLLTDPAAALAAGYNGETFQLTQAEYAAVTSLHVTNLRDFAAQLLEVMQTTANTGAELPRDLQFTEATISSRENARENFREQPTALPCKQEGDSAYTRFSAPSRRGRQSVAVNDGYRTTHSTNTHSSNSHILKRYES